MRKSKWEVTEEKVCDENGGNLVYIAKEESQSTQNLYKLNFKSGRWKRITQVFQLQNTQGNMDGKAVEDNFSSPDNPRTIQLIETKTGKTKTLLQAANQLSGYALGKLSIFKLKNADGDDMFFRMFKPVDFDSTKTYPVIAHWFVGPHSQM